MPADIPALTAASVALGGGDFGREQGFGELPQGTRDAALLRWAEGHVLGSDEQSMLGLGRGCDRQDDEVRSDLVGGR